MQIYVDVRCLQDADYAFRGVGHFAAGLVRQTRRWAPEAEIVGLLDPQLAPLADEHAELLDCVRCATTPRLDKGEAVFFEPSPMTHDPSWVAPLLGRRRLLSCAVVHDFIPLEAPDRYLPTTAKFRSYLNNLLWLKHYELFFPNSEHSGQRLQAVAGVAPDAIDVIGAPLREDFLSCSARRLREGAPPKNPQRGGYFLLVGGGDPRKNPECVLRALPVASKKLPAPPALRVVGAYGPAERERLAELFRKHGGDVRRLEFLQGIDDEELADLYAGAIATVCPSRLEGFSIPVVEALACGSPVLVSNCAAQRELVPQEEAQFDPDDDGRLAELMVRIATRHPWRRELLKRQAPVAAKFAEAEVGKRFWKRVLWECERRQHREKRRTVVAGSAKPRLAFLTPYPPDRSGVANYSHRTFDKLCEHATIDVFTDAPLEGPGPGVRRFSPLSELPYVVDEYDRIVAVVGNSGLHTKIIDYHCRYGGACLAHDNRLAELYSWWRGPERFARMASKSLGRAVSVDEARSWIDDIGQLPTILFDEILPTAEPLLVHSRGTQAQIAEQYGAPSQYLPFCVMETFDDEELTTAARMAARRRLGAPEDQLVVVSFGMVAPIKGAEECVWALEQLHAWKIPAHLYFVGSMEYMGPDVPALTERLRLSEHVHFMTDWVSHETFRDFLIAADFAVQLRKITLGQISGALSDCIGAGLPAVASRDLADSLEAPEYIRRVPDNLSPTLIAEQLADAYEAGLHRSRISARRTEYTEERSFDRYAERLMEALAVA